VKSLLTRIAIHKAVGLYLGEHEVVVSKLALTPLGPREIASSREPCTADDLAVVIERLLAPLVGRRRRVPVAVSLASSRLFFGTRLIPIGGETTPEAELERMLNPASFNADDLVLDLLRSSVNRARVTRMAVCRKKYMSGVVAILSRWGVRPFCAEPSPCSLLRLAEQRYRSPRRTRMVLRVFLGATQGLAVLVAGGLPLAWRPFALPHGQEAFAILSAGRGVTIQQGHHGIKSALDFAMIHGRPDLHERLQQEQFPTEMKTRVIWHEGPALDGASAAFGAALGCLAPDAHAFDLSRSLKSRASIKEIFPRGDLAFTTALLTAMGVVLGAHSLKLDDAYVRVRTENASHACLGSADQGRLEKDKKAIQEKVDAVRSFLGSRVLWSAYTRDISARMPPNAQLTTFYGKKALDSGGKGKAAAGSFQLQGMAPLSADGSIPHNIRAFLGAIPSDPLWKRDFASVVSEIKLPPPGKKAVPEVDFSITCVCKGKDAASPAKAAGGDKDKKEQP
jgi:hypothetical protein